MTIFQCNFHFQCQGKHLSPFLVDNIHSSLLVQGFLILLIRLMLPSGKINKYDTAKYLKQTRPFTF